MKKLVSIFFLAALIISCSGGGGSPNFEPAVIEGVVAPSNDRAYGVCRHEALIAAVIYEEAGFETRIMYGPMIHYGNEMHCQAQARINGKWRWLSTGRIDVFVDEQDDFEITKEYSVEDIFDFCISGLWF